MLVLMLVFLLKLLLKLVLMLMLLIVLLLMVLTPSLKKVILGPKQPQWETLIFLRDSPRLSGINNF